MTNEERIRVWAQTYYPDNQNIATCFYSALVKLDENFINYLIAPETKLDDDLVLETLEVLEIIQHMKSNYSGELMQNIECPENIFDEQLAIYTIDELIKYLSQIAVYQDDPQTKTN
jgi:hypothetical protein